MFRGMDIIEVEPETEIEGPDGEKMTVTDSEAITNGRTIYCTASMVAAMKARFGAIKTESD